MRALVTCFSWLEWHPVWSSAAVCFQPRSVVHPAPWPWQVAIWVTLHLFWLVCSDLWRQLGFWPESCEHFLSFFEHLLWTNGHEICRFIIIQITQTRMAVLKRKYLFFSQPTLFSVMEEQQPIPAAIGQAEVHAVLKIHAHEGRACKPERSNSTDTQTSDCHVVRHEH